MASLVIPERARAVGTVVTPLTITNRGDQVEVERGHHMASDVRSVTLLGAGA